RWPGRADRIVAMEEANPAGSKASSGPSFLARHHNLILRIVSAAVLVPLALAAAYAGGTVFLVFWAVAALLVLWEWMTLVCNHDRDPVLAIGAGALFGAAVLLAFG